MTELTVGSLFSGIGGLDLGLERAGMRVIWQTEIDPYASRVLKKHWPDIPNLGNVKEITWHEIERPDVICGGYPCQPFSLAGRRKAEDDPRHLFPWVADAIRILRPRYAILENVTGHLTAGFGTVLGTLAQVGYDARWDCVPAAAVGAPHLRDRVFIIATPRTEQRRPMANSNHQGPRDTLRTRWNAPWHGSQVMADASTRENSGRVRGPKETKGNGNPKHFDEPGIPIYDGWKWWDPEPDVGRVANGIPHRVDRLNGLGNAVVPQVAEYIGKMIVNDAKTE